MSESYFSGCFHLGHKAILKYRPKIVFRGETIFLENNLQHDELIVDIINSKVTKRDALYAMGDICFSMESIHLLGKLKAGRRYLVMGNHDTCHISEYAKYFDDIYGLRRYKDFWLSHCPIHPDELYGKFNIHSHLHTKNIKDSRYVNVNMDMVGHIPVSFTDIKKKVGIIK